MRDVTWFRPLELAVNGGAMLVQLTFKATLLLLVTFALVGILRRSSAALRHTLWSACCICLLLLPAFTVVLPAWQLPVMPFGPALNQAVTGSSQPGSIWKSTPILRDTKVASQNRVVTVVSTGQWILAATFVLWLSGVVVVTRKMALGFWATKRLQRHGRTLDEGPLWAEFMQSVVSLNLRCSALVAAPRLVIVANEVPIPLTWGCWHPVVLMPHASLGWSASCRRAALLHELSHIRRFDWLIQSLCSLACLFFWFHPLIWLASHRLRLESERATDDHVLTSGFKATDYSSSLLEIVRFVGSHHINGTNQKDSLMKFAVPMSGTSKIEIRLRSILDSKQSRSPVTRPLIAAISLAAFVAVVPLAAAKEPASPQLVSSGPTAQPDVAPPAQSRPPEHQVVTGIKFNGNTLLDADELQKALTSKTGVVLNPQSVAKDVMAVQQAYSDKGFAVTVEECSQDAGGVLLFSLLEAKLTQIKLTGITKTDPQQIRKLITTPVNAPFDATKLRLDLSRIYATKLFEDAGFKIDDDPEVPGGVIATFTLKE